LRIAFFVDAWWPRVNGVISSVDDFNKALKERGHQTIIVAPSYGKKEDALALETEVVRIPAVGAIISSEDRIALRGPAAREAIRKVEEFSPDIVHIQTEFTIGGLGRSYARNHGMPVISTCHTYWEMYIRSYVNFVPERFGKFLARTIQKAVYRNDDFIIAPTREIADVFRTYGIDKEFTIIPSGIDERIFKPSPEGASQLRARLAESFPALATGRVILFAGRIAEEKNISRLVKSMALVVAAVPDAILLMVGAGPGIEETKALAAKLGIVERVVFAGYLKRTELPAAYSMAEVFAFPSMTETQGLVTIEAMLCGTPVVGIERMGTAEIMRGDKGGFVTEDETEAYAAPIIRLLEDPVLRAAKSEEARTHGRQWSLDACTDRLEDLYEHARCLGAVPRR